MLADIDRSVGGGPVREYLLSRIDEAFMEHEETIVDWDRGYDAYSVLSGSLPDMAKVDAMKFAYEEMCSRGLIKDSTRAEHKRWRGFRVLGWAPTLKYRYREASTSDSGYYKDFLATFGLEEFATPEIWMKEFRPPSIEDLLDHLFAFDETNFVGSGGFDARIAAGVRAFDALMPPLEPGEDWLSVDKIRHLRVPRSTSPGLRYRKMGFKTKGEALPLAVRNVIRDVRGMYTGKAPLRTYLAVAGRGKAIDRLTEEEFGKQGRLILMADVERHVRGAIAMHHVTRWFSDRSDISRGGPMVGVSLFGGGWTRLHHHLGELWAAGWRLMCVDMKGHDRNIPAAMIRSIFEYLSGKFPVVPGSPTYWESEVREALNSLVVLPDGTILEKQTGIASGDPWTTVLGTIANYIGIHSAFHDVDSAKWRAWVFGDDSVVAVHPSVWMPIEKFKARLWELSHFEVSVKKSYTASEFSVAPGTVPIFGRHAQFLSTYFTPLGDPLPARDDIVMSLLHPERNRGSLDWELARTACAYVLGFWDEELRLHLELYFEYLLERAPPDPTLDEFDWQLFQLLDYPLEMFKPGMFRKLPAYDEVVNLHMFGSWNFEGRKVSRFLLGPILDDHG